MAFVLYGYWRIHNTIGAKSRPKIFLKEKIMGTKKLFYFVVAAMFVMAVAACAQTAATQDAGVSAEQTSANAEAAQAAQDAANAAQEAAAAAQQAADAAASAADEAANAGSQAAEGEAAQPVEGEDIDSSGAPMLSVSEPTNCRVGPGDEYAQVGSLDTNTKVKITGWDGYGIFYVVENPAGGDDCWVWAEYATIEGDVSGLELVKVPPTPMPDTSWAGTWLMKIDGKTYNIVLSQDSKVVYGQFKVGDTTYKFNGVVNGDATQVDGKWVYTDEEDKDHEGRFRFVMVEGTYNQFQGVANPNTGKAWEWCGGRSGAGLPGTCMLP
jgi:hypothetical protein